MFKVILFTVLLAFSSAEYAEEDDVLVLTDNDFPKVFEDFTHILV